MKKACVTVLILVIMFLIPSVCVYAEEIGRLEYDGMIIEADYPSSLDCYIVAHHGVIEEDEWSTKIYSYTMIEGVPLSEQKVTLVSMSLEGDDIVCTDNRGVVYILSAATGEIKSKDDSAYSLPDFDVSYSSDEKPNEYTPIIVVVVVCLCVGVLIYYVSHRTVKE